MSALPTDPATIIARLTAMIGEQLCRCPDLVDGIGEIVDDDTDVEYDTKKEPGVLHLVPSNPLGEQYRVEIKVLKVART